jgi:hypothetical protein
MYTEKKRAVFSTFERFTVFVVPGRVPRGEVSRRDEYMTIHNTAIHSVAVTAHT